MRAHGAGRGFGGASNVNAREPPRVPPGDQVRKIVQSIAFLGPAIALWPLANVTSAGAALTCFTAALGLAAFGQAGFVANIQDVAPRQAGILFGLANTLGCIAGMLSTSFVGFALKATGGAWGVVFGTQVTLYAMGTVAWLLMCSGEPAQLGARPRRAD